MIGDFLEDCKGTLSTITKEKAVIPAAVLMTCLQLSNLQDSVLSNLGDGQTLTVATVRLMHTHINDALDHSETCIDESNALIETQFGLEEIIYQLNKSKEVR